ncbi:MAG: 50S ribosomal protein L2 [Promethearchaeota archaeon]
MGKRILAQRKGYGHLWARSPSHRHVGKVKYRPFKNDEKLFKFKVIDFLHAPGRGAPVARIRYEDGEKGLWLPPEGIYEGQEFFQSKTGNDQEVKVGNILPLKKMPIGTLVFNIEGNILDGGKFARASGVSAIVKPFLKAGNAHHAYRSKAKKWPVVRGVTMNAASHPYGGGAKQSPHKPTTTSRNAPPGRKVGQIAARRTGHQN